ncbi:MAG: hypothetical protein JXB60_04215 [Candidatus Cloacimonetes bacterium]|nr:hypothetical protein [Candidatus Cloacimonadota bacterium]
MNNMIILPVLIMASISFLVLAAQNNFTMHQKEDNEDGLSRNSRQSCLDMKYHHCNGLKKSHLPVYGRHGENMNLTSEQQKWIDTWQLANARNRSAITAVIEQLELDKEKALQEGDFAEIRKISPSILLEKGKLEIS